MAAIENTSTLSALASLLLKPEVKNIWYNAKEVKIDGFKFISCRFDSCILVVTSTNFELVDCHVSDNTTIRFGSEIVKPIRLFHFRADWAYKDFPFFAPTKNPDGTITVRAEYEQ